MTDAERPRRFLFCPEGCDYRTLYDGRESDARLCLAMHLQRKKHALHSIEARGAAAREEPREFK